MNLKEIKLKLLFSFGFILTGIANFVDAQPCNGSWATNNPITYQCITGQWIGQGTVTNPVGCPPIPVYTVPQTNTFNFDNPVNDFILDFVGYSGSTCARMELKINGVFYPLTIANLFSFPPDVLCPGIGSMAITAEGYLTGVLSQLGKARLVFNNVIASSVTISTNDPQGIVITSPCMPLVVPIKLKWFKGEIANCKAILNWQSEIELNVRNIEIQVSVDGITYKKIAEVISKGNNSQYAFMADQFTNSFYRLKINDLDGNYKYSEILNLRSNCNKVTYQIFPNPAQHLLNIIGVRENDLILVLDMQGRKLLSFNATFNDQNFDIQKLAPGVYNLQVNHAGSINTNLKFVKN